MSRRRAVVHPDTLRALADGAPLPVDATHYLTAVLRLSDGATVVLADGSGNLVEGRLTRTGQKWHLTEVVRSSPGEDDRHPITLLAGLLKPKRWRMVVEKSVELGVLTVVPIVSRHVAFVPRQDDHRKLADRWNRIARDAAKQCRRPSATRVEPPTPLESALQALEQRNRLLAHTVGGHTEWPTGLHPLEPTALLVGPEGGWTPDEVAMATEAGFVTVSLGGAPLRAETAAIALVVLARDRLGYARAERSPCP